MLLDYNYLLIRDSKNRIVDWYPADCEEDASRDYAYKNVKVEKVAKLPWLNAATFDNKEFLPILFHSKDGVCDAVVFEEQGMTSNRLYAVMYKSEGKDKLTKFASYRQAINFLEKY